jgi:hypothetical protein
MYYLASSLRGFASSGRSLAPHMRSNLASSLCGFASSGRSLVPRMRNHPVPCLTFSYNWKEHG